MPIVRVIPLFPLGLVLFPGERLPLHIYEPKYKKMVQYCQEAKKPFGIVLFHGGKLAPMGCTVNIFHVLRQYEDGRSDIIVEGKDRFRLLEILHKEEYLTANVEMIEEPAFKDEDGEMERAIALHMKLLELSGMPVRPSYYQDVNNVSFLIASNAALQLIQKQHILELEKEVQRIAFLAEHLEKLIPRVEKAEDIRRLAQSNGHPKDYRP